MTGFNPTMGFGGFGRESYPSAQNTFTDREDFRQLLIKAVETPQAVDEHRVKVIYGAGGQGKSALKEEFFFKMYLNRLHLEGMTLIKVDKLNFESREDKFQTRQADEGLLRVAEVLIANGVPMPAFCLGFIRYQMLSSPASNLQQTYPFLFKTKLLGKHSGGVMDTLTDQLFSTIAGSLVEIVAQGVPIIGFFAKQAANKARLEVVEWLRRAQVMEVLGDLDELSASKLLARLPKLLAYDVYQYLLSDLGPNGIYPSKRIIITIDGYEGIWDADMFHHADRDIWVRQLVKYLPGVLFVIFGRDRLRWASLGDATDAAFDDILDQHLLRGLSDADADHFLQLVGIAEAEIRREIVEGAKDADNPDDGCLPFYLDLQAHQYYQMKDRGLVRTAASFMNSRYQSVVERFYKHLQKPVADAIKQLSLANYLDEEIIDLFRAHRFIEPNAVSMPLLQHYSFVKKTGNSLTMHGLMREMSQLIITEEFGSLRTRQIQQMLFEYFEAKLKVISPPETYEMLTAAAETLLEQAAHHKQLADPAGHVAWVLGHARHFYGQDVHGALMAMLKNAERALLGQKKAATGKDTLAVTDFNQQELAELAELAYWLCQRYHWGDQYEQAIEYATHSLTFSEAALPPAA